MPRSPVYNAGSPASPRSRKGVETRARLVEAAKEEFEEAGFLAARITDISTRAGLSHGSFYHYFESKEEIFREVAQLQERSLTQRPDRDEGEAESRAEISPREQIRNANRRYLEQYRDEARIMGLIEQVSRYDDHVRSARAATQRVFADRAERNIRKLQADGVADASVDPVIAATALGAMIARFAELWLVQGYASYDFDDAVEQLTTLWCNALGLPAEAP